MNYYKMLGFNKDQLSDRLGEDDIKKMYYEMAKKYHPDSQYGDENKFK